MRAKKDGNIKGLEKRNTKKNIVISSMALLTGLLVIAVLVCFWNWEDTSRIQIAKLTDASLNHSAWIKAERIYVAGDAYENQEEIQKWEKIVQVAISDEHILALDCFGTVHAAGSNASLQCEIDGLEKVVYIEANRNCSIGVMENGTVQIFGIMEAEIRQQLLQEKNVCEVALGDDHTVVLHNNGRVTAYGNNECGQCDVEQWRGIQKISVGYDFTVGMTADGKVLIVGNKENNLAELKKWSEIVDVVAGHHFVIGKDRQGILYAVGDNRQGECEVKEWKKVVSIAAGYDHSIAVNEDGELLAVGYNGNGQCKSDF